MSRKSTICGASYTAIRHGQQRQNSVSDRRVRYFSLFVINPRPFRQSDPQSLRGIRMDRSFPVVALLNLAAIGTGLTRADPPRIRKVDLSDFRAVEELIEEVNPSVIVHR